MSTPANNPTTSPPSVVTTAASISDEARWRAVCERAPDDSFVFAVRSTGIYCRPSCPARRPLRKNVAFFDDVAAARTAGYRACRRCDPDGAGLQGRHRELVLRACETIAAVDSLPSLDELARQAGLSRYHFHRVFKEIVGMTPHAYGRALRKQRVGQALSEAASVTDALYAAGFNAPSRFYEGAADSLGMAPAVAQRGAPGETIRHAVVPSPLGPMLVAATARGVCAVEFGDSADALLRGLGQRYRAATLVAGDPQFAGWVQQILQHLAEPGQAGALPLDVRGTVFQQQVWRALQQIPPGTTLSYTELAARLGKQEAVRAVARACATNEVAVLIPCHRVLRRDGQLAGYRWGLARKADLLRREAAARAQHEGDECVREGIDARAGNRSDECNDESDDE
ncbi:bifunctional DNA-binding transcriptional regulator/O6-methylguanine-DNA methyltransferase Ada [Uliginosibacterium sp. H1]|uniref:bifunctional DNA-binding transcriptional regulator/O6-methylguanine-DNA methyltransferase Ada n=1 Tax=Uliginosibacterium sp. H1 TaxID=3114757 RepID=UPI002E199326|nr:bifunctional DNA-binding transcriptional regulator/O6-methylguanine-DNA methyltransferase Ada [Uliginosibacterium sp. H1]